MHIAVGARNSELSQAQVKEVLQELSLFHPEIQFILSLKETTGDKDLKTSLRNLEKTDFFTREIDEELLQGHIRIAVHSAKDLPDPLPKGLKIIAITKGVDSSDSLVLREKESLHSLHHGAAIGTSSERREAAVKSLRSDLCFKDIRGTITKRLKLLQENFVDGVVIAEAALIRLGLTHLNRIRLETDTAPLQGKLAVVAREKDVEMMLLFSCIDYRKSLTSLYLGIDPPFSSFCDRKLVHRPIITVVPRQNSDIKDAFEELPLYTHLIFTSKNSVRFFFRALPDFGFPLLFLEKKTFIAVGKATEKALEEQGFRASIVAKEETAEGLLKELHPFKESLSYFFWPHSNLARPTIANFLKENHLKHKACVLYDTYPNPSFSMPDLSFFEEIIFTSPSTVDAFLSHASLLPKNKKLTSIGPVTESYLKTRLDEF